MFIPGVGKKERGGLTKLYDQFAPRRIARHIASYSQDGQGEALEEPIIMRRERKEGILTANDSPSSRLRACPFADCIDTPPGTRHRTDGSTDIGNVRADRENVVEAEAVIGSDCIVATQARGDGR